MKKLRIYNLKESFNQAALFSGAAFSTAISLQILNNPSMALAGVVSALATHIWLSYNSKVVLNAVLPASQWPDSFDFHSPKMDLIYNSIQETTEKLRIKDAPALLLHDAGAVPEASIINKYDPSKKIREIRYLVNKQYREMPNIVNRHYGAAIAFAGTILNELNEKELCTSVQHEMAHIKAKHTQTTMGTEFTLNLARHATELNFYWAGITSWENAGSILLGTILSKLTINDLLNEKFPHWSDAHIKAHLNTIGKNGLIALMAISLDAHSLLAPLALYMGTNYVSELISKGLSRQQEFQADRIAINLSQDPQSFKSGLEKVTKLNTPTENHRLLDPHKPKTIFARAAHYIYGLFDSHPSAHDRVKSIDKISASLHI